MQASENADGQMFESQDDQSSNREAPDNLNEFNVNNTLNTQGDMVEGAGISEPPVNSFDMRDLEERREIEEHRMRIIRQQRELQNQLDQLDRNLNDRSARNLQRQQIFATHLHTGDQPDRNRSNHRHQGVDIRRMREEYTVSQGKDFELKLPNNTFNQLFFKPGDSDTKRSNAAPDPLNFEFEDKQGKPHVIRLRKGQKLLLQDAHQ